jgi:hypothetical protein
MATSRQYHLTLAALLLWLGLFDGFVRLKTGAHALTLVRDALLYAIVVGWLIRESGRRHPLRLPPMSGWVLAFVVVVAVQLFNPANASFGHAIAALRPHLEFVPLFFLGYGVMRTRQRVRMFLALLLAIATINAVVAGYQSRLSPETLATWGPGYAERIGGTGDVSGRVAFASGSDTPFVRPFALGSDSGFGGLVGLLAAPAALALFALTRRPGTRAAIFLLAGGVIAAVATSQARTAVLATVGAVGAFLALGTASGRNQRILLAAIVVGLLAFAVAPRVAVIGGFDRYESIAPGRALATTYDYRRESFSKLPGYITEFPFGAGLGSVGPAGGRVAANETRDLDAENEFNFLVIELGVPGLVVLLLFNVWLLVLVTTRLRRVPDAELRLLLAALAAPLFGLLLSWIVGIATATSPGSPYFWFVGGTLAYWLTQTNVHRDGATLRQPCTALKAAT